MPEDEEDFGSLKTFLYCGSVWVDVHGSLWRVVADEALEALFFERQSSEDRLPELMRPSPRPGSRVHVIDGGGSTIEDITFSQWKHTGLLESAVIHSQGGPSVYLYAGEYGPRQDLCSGESVLLFRSREDFERFGLRHVPVCLDDLVLSFD